MSSLALYNKQQQTPFCATDVINEDLVPFAMIAASSENCFWLVIFQLLRICSLRKPVS